MVPVLICTTLGFVGAGAFPLAESEAPAVMGIMTVSSTAAARYVIHFLRSVYKELHADHETGAADNK